tara:strand:+ start:1584 stop:1934 length:351 start_codon:yes stop_codon:yes gene_type:complete
MEEFNKLKDRDWRLKVSYQLSSEESEILKTNATSKEEQTLILDTLQSIESKNTKNPTAKQLEWLKHKEDLLTKDLDMEKYELAAIEINRTVTKDNGIEYSGIFNYFIGNSFNQVRF